MSQQKQQQQQQNSAALAALEATQKRMAAKYSNKSESELGSPNRLDDAPTLVQTNIHGKSESTAKHSKKYITFSLFGTPDEFQEQNPLALTENGALAFKSKVSDRSSQSASFKQLFGEKFMDSRKDCVVEIVSVEVDGLINNAPYPVALMISGLKSGPNFKLSHTTYDKTLKDTSRAFASAFSPMPSVTVSEQGGNNPKIDFTYAGPTSDLFEQVANDQSKASPVHLKAFACGDAFGISSGSVQCETNDNGDKSCSPTKSKLSTEHHDHVSLIARDDPNMTINTILATYTNALGKHVVLIPQGSPLHVAFKEGHISDVLKKTRPMLVSVLKKSVSLPRDAEKIVRRAMKEAKKRGGASRTNARDLSTQPQSGAYEYDVETLVELLGSLKSQETSKSDGRSAKLQEWIDLIGETNPNLQSLLLNPIWSASSQPPKSDRVTLVELPNNVVQLYLLTLFKVVGSKTHLRNLTGCLVRLDSPTDWTAKGRLTPQQHDAIKSKPFSIEVKICINMRVEKIISHLPKKKKALSRGGDDSSEEVDGSSYTENSSSEDYTSVSDTTESSAETQSQSQSESETD